MEDQILEKAKGLFQEAYSVIYNDGKFDAMADQAEADGDVTPAVSQLVSALLNSMIKDAGVEDLNVLFAVGTMLAADLLEALQQIGMEAPEDAMGRIIQTVMQTVFGENPQIAQAVASNPAMKEAMAGVTGGGQQATPAPQQGVMGGVPNGQ